MVAKLPGSLRVEAGMGWFGFLVCSPLLPWILVLAKHPSTPEFRAPMKKKRVFM